MLPLPQVEYQEVQVLAYNFSAIPVTIPARVMHRGFRDFMLFLHHPCYQPGCQENAWTEFQLHAAEWQCHCFYASPGLLQPVGLNDRRLIQITDAQKHHLVTTPSKRMPRSFRDLHIIFASSLLAPLPGGRLKASETCILFVRHPCYRLCKEDAQKSQGLAIYFCIFPVTTPASQKRLQGGI